MYIYIYIDGIEKDGTYEPICKAAKDTQRTNLRTVGEGEGGMNCENNIEAYILPYIE